MLASSAAAAACTSVPAPIVPTASPAHSGPTAAIVEPAPTSAPRVIFLSGRTADPLVSFLRDWTVEQVWEWVQLTPQEMEAGWAADPSVRVGIGYESEGFPPTLSPSTDWSAIVLEAASQEVSRRVHTVGTPGARYDQAAFLVGVLSGLASGTEYVGLISSTGGPKAVVIESGFLAGVRYGCPRCRVLTWTPAEVTADALRANAIDVLFAIPGPEAAAGLLRAADVDLWLVWLESPPEPGRLNRIAGGVVFDLRGPALRALQAAASGTAGMAWPFSAKHDGLLIVDPDPEAIPPGRARLLEAAWAGLRDGTLAIGIDPETGLEP